MERKLRMAIVGMGYIGHRHAAMIEGNEEMELVGVVDVRSAESCGVPKGVGFYGSVGEMLREVGDVDVVSVCTPNGYHADIAIEALRGGANVLMEKPLALSMRDVERIGEAMRESGKRVVSVFQNRCTPTSKWLKEIVSDGVIGRVTSVVVNCQWNRDERYYKPGSWHGMGSLDGGPLYTQFSHYLDILMWLVGDIEVLSGVFGDYVRHDMTDFEDTGAFIFRTVRDGAIGTFNYTTAVAGENLETAITLVGSKGSVKVGGQYMSDVLLCKIAGYDMPELPAPNPPNDYGAYKGSAANHGYVFENIADVLLRGEEPMATFEDGARVVRVVEQVYGMRKESYRSKNSLVYNP